MRERFLAKLEAEKPQFNNFHEAFAFMANHIFTTDFGCKTAKVMKSKSKDLIRLKYIVPGAPTPVQMKLLKAGNSVFVIAVANGEEVANNSFRVPDIFPRATSLSNYAGLANGVDHLQDELRDHIFSHITSTLPSWIGAPYSSAQKMDAQDARRTHKSLKAQFSPLVQPKSRVSFDVGQDDLSPFGDSRAAQGLIEAGGMNMGPRHPGFRGAHRPGAEEPDALADGRAGELDLRHSHGLPEPLPAGAVPTGARFDAIGPPTPPGLEHHLDPHLDRQRPGAGVAGVHGLLPGSPGSGGAAAAGQSHLFPSRPQAPGGGSGGSGMLI